MTARHMTARRAGSDRVGYTRRPCKTQGLSMLVRMITGRTSATWISWCLILSRTSGLSARMMRTTRSRDSGQLAAPVAAELNCLAVMKGAVWMTACVMRSGNAPLVCTLTLPIAYSRLDTCAALSRFVWGLIAGSTTFANDLQSTHRTPQPRITVLIRTATMHTPRRMRMTTPPRHGCGAGSQASATHPVCGAAFGSAPALSRA